MCAVNVNSGTGLGTIVLCGGTGLGTLVLVLCGGTGLGTSTVSW